MLKKRLNASLTVKVLVTHMAQSGGDVLCLILEAVLRLETVYKCRLCFTREFNLVLYRWPCQDGKKKCWLLKDSNPLCSVFVFCGSSPCQHLALLSIKWSLAHVLKKNMSDLSVWRTFCICISCRLTWVLFSPHAKWQTGGGGHLRKETSPADSRGGTGRFGEVGFGRPQTTPSKRGPGGRQPSQSLLRPE